MLVQTERIAQHGSILHCKYTKSFSGNKGFYTKKIHPDDMRWILVFYVVVQEFILHLGAANKADDEGEWLIDVCP